MFSIDSIETSVSTLLWNSLSLPEHSLWTVAALSNCCEYWTALLHLWQYLQGLSLLLSHDLQFFPEPSNHQPELCETTFWCDQVSCEISERCLWSMD